MASHSSAGLIQNPISMYILIHAPRVPPVATAPVVTDIEQFGARLIWGNVHVPLCIGTLHTTYRIRPN